MESVNTNISTIRAPFPPRAARFPLIGSLPDIIRHKGNYFLEAWKQYGDIYRLNIGPVDIVVLNRPDYAQHVLRDHARNYTKGGSLNEALRGLLGNGLVTSEGDYWRRQRRMMQPQFHRQYLAGITGLMNEAIEEAMRDWDELAASGEPVEVLQLYSRVTMNVIMKTMFGRGINPDEAQAAAEAFSYIIRYLMQEIVTGSLPEWVPVPGRKKYREALATVDEFIYRMIRQRRENPTSSMDIVSMMTQMVDEDTNEPMTDVEIRDEAITIFGAGYETTSVAMAWGSHLLTRATDIQDKLRSHVDEVLQGRSAQFEDLRGLSYSAMVFSEIMRLYPPAPLLTRMAVEEDYIDGYRIKAGQTVFIMTAPIHHHPDFWSNAEDFNPERFSPAAEKGRHPLAWMPFGAGQRQCIGKDFAMMEGTLILSRLMQHYRLVAADKPDPEFALAVTLAPKDGIWVRLEKR